MPTVSGRMLVGGRFGAFGRAFAMAATLLLLAPLEVRAQPHLGGSSFTSNFTSGHAGWYDVAGTWSVTAEGYYKSKGLANDTSSVKHSDSFTDFTYQVKMKRTGCRTCANRLIIRGDPDWHAFEGWYPCYAIETFNDGSYAVIRMSEAGLPSAIKVRGASAALHKGERWNRVKIRAVGGDLTLFFNDTQVWSYNGATTLDGMVGIAFDRKAARGSLLVDWARLSTATADAPPSFAGPFLGIPRR